MDDILKISKTTLTFEIDQASMKRAIDHLELQNPDQNTRKGFKIKSTNIARYVVSPASGIIDPLKTVKIDIMLALRPEDDISRLNDKFRLYCIEIDDDNVTKQNIDQYIRKKEGEIKKSSIGVRIVDKQETRGHQRGSLSFEPTEGLRQSVNQRTSEQEPRPDSVLYESIVTGGQSNWYQDSRVSAPGPGRESRPTGLEGLLVEKENEILKLKETNSMLEKDISMIRGKILLDSNSKVSGEGEKVKVWKILLMLLIGLIVGALLNSAYPTTVVE